MNKEIKVRMICFLIGIFLISGSYFLSGEWRNEYVGDNGGFIPGKPIFEFMVRDGTCENNVCPIGISSNVVIGFLGVIVFAHSIAPIKLKNDVSCEVEE